MRFNAVIPPTEPLQVEELPATQHLTTKIIEFVNGMPLCDLLINQCANGDAQQ
jgi:hypothetical protein